MTLDLASVSLPAMDTAAISPPDLSPVGREALAHLMIDAYRGTPDDAGETLADARVEIERLITGVFGPFDHGASNVIRKNGQLAAATLFTRDKLGPRGGSPTHDPFLAFSMTAASHKRQGLARLGLVAALHTLRQRGDSRAHLVVSQNNPAAINLYVSLGFQPMA